MSYTITLTNGTIKTEVADGQINQVATDLTLIGKNISGYGTYINDNFIRLLENFANTSQPNHPLLGQLWYDTNDSKLKVYNGLGFVPTTSTAVVNTIPSTISSGDIVIHSTFGQLFFNDGIATRLAGPIYTTDQGLSGFYVDTILEANSNNSHVIMYLYLGKSLLGIFAKERFLPKVDIPGFPSNTYLEVGFNVSSFAGMKFNVPVTSAQYLVDSNDNLIAPEQFVSTTNSTSTMSGSLFIQNSIPLVFGVQNNNEFLVDTSAFIIQSNLSNQNFGINTNDGLGVKNALFINGTTNRVGIFKNNPTKVLDVAGTGNFDSSVTIQGSLTVGQIGDAQLAPTFTTGQLYKIASIGSTDFTSFGAASNTVGIYFTKNSNSSTGTGTANLITKAQISNVAEPVDLFDAANKNYVDTRPLPLYVPTTSNSTAASILIKVFPNNEHPEATIARVVYSDGSVHRFILTSGLWVHDTTL
jgi:hypothetical protein